jgi:hypothetical protein
LKAGRVKRKTLVAREDLVDRLSEVAKHRGYSLYAMVNEVLELAVKAEETGVDLRRVVEERGILEAARRGGFILGLESLWYEMAELAYEKAQSRALKSWFEAGVWLAKRYATSGVEDAFEAFKRDLEAFTWNALEFAMERMEGRVLVRIISPRFTESYTVLLASFLEGALEAFGYKIANKEVSRGAIRLEALQGGSQ